ncbi:response regulator transcription factor [Demequina litorisediminis]|uniref:Response regulatory domain-containing protein n=1 Tax=Demequina litorisediminis TaxID=1849022 RepID=A0ABQ6IEA3_9MICO|nr:hypothetical protein GCM10025876_23640 [Demequina litorisediminis]
MKTRLVASLIKGLRTADIEVEAVRTGREGLERAINGNHDIMLLDIGLPDQEGFTVLRRLRSSGSDLPVIILTARTSAEDTVRGLERGADDYMAKPFVFDEPGGTYPPAGSQAQRGHPTARRCDRGGPL